MLTSHCISFFRIVVLMSLDECKCNRHGICIYEIRNRPPERFGNTFIQVSQVREDKPVFAEKCALTRSAESVLLSPNKRAQELLVLLARYH